MAIGNQVTWAVFLGGQYSDHRHIQGHRDRGKEKVKGQFAHVARPDG